MQEFIWYNCSAVCGSSARQLYGGVNGDFLQEALCHTQVCCTQSPYPCNRPLLTCPSAGDTRTLKGRSGSVSVRSPGAHKVLIEPSEHLWWILGLILNSFFPILAQARRVAQSQTRLNNFTFTFHFHALEKEMATHSSVLAWRIPGTGEPGGLPSMGSYRVGHDWSDLAGAAAAQAGIKTARRNINNLRYADDTILMAESEEELKSLLMKVKEESERGR